MLPYVSFVSWQIEIRKEIIMGLLSDMIESIPDFIDGVADATVDISETIIDEVEDVLDLIFG